MGRTKGSQSFDGRGLINFSQGKALSAAISRVPPEAWSIALWELEGKTTFTENDRIIKANLWRLLTSEPIRDDKIPLRKLYQDVTTATNFYNHFLTNHFKIVWLLKPEISFQKKIQLFQSILVQRLDEIVHLPILDTNGKPNLKNIRNILSVTKVLFGLSDKI